MIELYNTLHRQKEVFEPLQPGIARLYACGPTVYAPAHIGNLRAYVFADVLKRTLKRSGLKVVHAINITDVGHLTGDDDSGQDKLEVGAACEARHPLAIAGEYEKAFWRDFDALGCQRPDKVARATETIDVQIALIQKLEARKMTYRTEQAVYFDTEKFDGYGRLAGQNLADKKPAARADVVTDDQKRHPGDFALWFLVVGRHAHHILRWPSPWGDGFPGWHTECSAISTQLLGQPFDIHTGGVDLIGTHHENEIAQSEAAEGRPLARFWLHSEHLLVDGQKMSKSLGNLYTLDDLTAKHFSPLDFRYLCLAAHYRSKINFTWDSLAAARTTLQGIRHLTRHRTSAENAKNQVDAVLANDLDTPRSLALLHEANNSALWREYDDVFGLNLAGVETVGPLPDEAQSLADERQAARARGDFAASDVLRDRLRELGYTVADTPAGQIVQPDCR